MRNCRNKLGDCFAKPRKNSLLTLSHSITCAISILIVMHYLLMCYFSFCGARADMSKFEGLGFSYSFLYHLQRNSFPKAVQMAGVVTVELLFYLILCHRAERKKHSYGSIMYFFVLLMIHIGLWCYVAKMEFPELPPYITANGVNMSHYIFLSITAVQSIVYSVLYFVRVRIVYRKQING